MTTADEIGWVATSDTLERLVAALKRTSLAAVDTEFVREKTYYPQLCLIQIATRDEVACIDCLAPLDLSPLYAELFRADFTWVLHSARQDLEVVWQRAQRMPPRLIDTQIAAALTGTAPQMGLEHLLARTLGVELGESYARTDWSRRRSHRRLQRMRSTMCATCSPRGTGSRRGSQSSAARPGSTRNVHACSPNDPKRTR